MAKLRNAVIDLIHIHLGYTRLGETAFSASFPESGQTLCKVVFTPEPKFSFEIMNSGSRDKDNLFVRCSPGRNEINELLNMATMVAALNEISPWSDRIEEELGAYGAMGL